MTEQRLNELFDAARKVPSETTAKEVAGWVSGAAGVATATGLALKLKVLLTKKMMMMLGGILVTAGAITTGVILFSTTTEKVVIASNDVLKTPESKSIVLDSSTLEQAQKNDEGVMSSQETTMFPVNVPRPVTPQVPSFPVRPAFPLAIPSIPGLIVPSSPAAPVAPVAKRNHGNAMTREARQVGSFDEIHLEGVMNVYLKIGEKESVEVETEDEFQKEIHVEVRGGKLYLNGEAKRGGKSHTVNIYVAVKELKAMNHSGVGDIRSEANLTINALDLNVSGVGDVNLKMDAKSVKLNFSGVGNAEFEGKSDELEVHFSGVGDYRGTDFKCKNAQLFCSGVGDGFVNASEKLEIHFSGIGKVRYYGNPKKKEIEANGLGGVKEG